MYGLPVMNKQQLLASVAKSTGLSMNAVRDVLDATFDAVTAELRSSGQVKLSGFVRFKVVDVKERRCRNPQTGGTMTIAAHRKVKAFPVGAVKEAVTE